ncbi:hypothetical protein KVR01_007124 [Diaporthe batatas]|uniref:uncharacterized protein n=1 Tax=Diaporthe batatas TaxID=748121 RepID=UPI001D0513BD|nr:uncharacterized protein KVR01_007124 [Diaporthe batatas]KAG8162646.1 hypothetical protein KVR01_007124 [Diaporthe batatas]
MAPGLLKGALLLGWATAVVPTSSLRGRQAPQSADYVIIGGGPAGFVVAEYLSRDSSKNVMLLEVGPDATTNFTETTPAMFLQTFAWMWRYNSAPETSLNGRTPDLVQGRALGGGTAVNGMTYCRGAASVFDEWARISGNDGLAWDSMLQAFQETTHWTDYPNLTYTAALNRTAFGNGPIEVTRPRELFSIDQPFHESAASILNLPEIDFASGGGIGVSLGMHTIRSSNRTRHFAANTYGYMANGRANYRVVPNAWVSKIGFTGTQADSVMYQDLVTLEDITISAKEVIVAAGAINTPQILKLSGVGPADELNGLQIPVVMDVPQVGQNLVNHHYAVAQYEARPTTDSLWQLQSNSTRKDIEISRYRENGDGMLGTIFGSNLVGFRLPDSNLPPDRPHVALYASSSPLLSDGPNISIVSGFASVVQPESSGNVTLASANYLDAPVINSNYWGTASEVAAVKQAYTRLREIFHSQNLRPYWTREQYPGRNLTGDADLWAAIQGSSHDWHHPVGTAALGTVLDARWRVKGLSGLRVIGSAAMPTITTCPIQAAVYAIAYRSAVDIARDDNLMIGCNEDPGPM